MNLSIKPEGLTSRVLVLADAVGATQYISFLQPLAQSVSEGSLTLRLEPHNKSKQYLEDIIKRDRPDVVVFSRYTRIGGRALAEIARNRDITTIFHIDDDLLNVPESLGPQKYAAYNEPSRLAALRENMEAVDLLYASTPALAAAFESYGLAVPIRAGDIYCSIDPVRIPPLMPSTIPTIGYMGTGGHSQDLSMILPAVIALMDEMPFIRFETYGTIDPPPSLARFGRRYSHHSPVANYVAFLDKLCSLGWWVGLAPLEDNGFNRCKADTKWVEYSYAGMATIATDLPVYSKACSDGDGILAKSVDDWYGAMRKLIANADFRHRQIAGARQKLRTVYSHDRLHRQVLAVFAEARGYRSRGPFAYQGAME